MTTEAHEQAHEALHYMFVRKFALMNGLDLQLHITGQAQKESNGCKKKADQSRRPKTLPGNRSDYWYSVLIESAYLEKRSKLADDALLVAGRIQRRRKDGRDHHYSSNYQGDYYRDMGLSVMPYQTR